MTTDQTQDSLSGPLLRYRAMAYATGVLLILLTINVVLKYVLDQAGMGTWIAIAHGWCYLAYVVFSVDLWFRTRLRPVPMIGVVLAGTIPLASFVAERWVVHQLAARSRGLAGQ